MRETRGAERKRSRHRGLKERFFLFFFVIGILLSLGFLLVSLKSGGAAAVDKSKRKIN